MSKNSSVIFISEKVDIWSAGTVLYMLLSGRQPFDNKNVDELIKLITKGEIKFEDEIWNTIS